MSNDLKRKITDLPLKSGINKIEEQDKALLERLMREQLERTGAGARAVANAKVPGNIGEQDFIDIQVRVPVGKGLTQEARQKIADAVAILVRETVDNNLDQLRHLGAVN